MLSETKEEYLDPDYEYAYGSGLRWRILPESWDPELDWQNEAEQQAGTRNRYRTLIEFTGNDNNFVVEMFGTVEEACWLIDLLGIGRSVLYPEDFRRLQVSFP